MFKYNLKKQGIDIIDTILSNRDLTFEEANKIINPENYGHKILNPYTFKNMLSAVEVLEGSIKRNFKIGILIDSDADGYCSSAMLYHYLTEVLNYKNVLYMFHDKPKAHGFQDYVTEWVKGSNIQLLIVPDAGCGLSDEENQKGVYDIVENIIILDHHIPEYKPKEKVIMVNPHQNDCEYNNKYLSGAGVTHKFIEACNIYFGIDVNYNDLVALSIVSDMMNLKASLENRLYLNLGSNNISSPLIQEVIDTKGISNITIEDLAFSIAPLINATVRVGESSEKDLVFRSLFEDKLVPSTKRGSVGEMVSCSSEACRIAGNIKRRQDKLRDKATDKVCKAIEELELDKNKVIIVKVDGLADESMTGLIANKLVGIYNKPMILLRSVDGGFRGSARTVNENPILKNFKNICIESGLFEFASGHQGSFGVGVSDENISKLNDYFNTKLKDIEATTLYEVDALYDGSVPFADIKEVANLSRLWCFDIKEPTFLVKNISINTKDINKIGNATYTFKSDKTIFTKHFGSKVWYETLLLRDKLPFGGSILVDMICKFKNRNGAYYIDIQQAKSVVNDVYDF